MSEFYLTQQHELDKFDRISTANGCDAKGGGFLKIITTLSAGNKELFEAMWSFENFAHAADDILDEGLLNEEQSEAFMTMLHDAVCAALLSTNLTPLGLFLNIYESMVGNSALEENRRFLALKAARDFFRTLIENNFVIRNASELRGMYVQAMTRALDGEAMALDSNPANRTMARVVRCGDVDVLFHMVYLARGFAALRECSKVRKYDIESEATKT
jgi:hypothetical protein